ncbi:MAG TPA: SPOR domain-containing protein [Pseudomonadales bacterium]|nr:SPOR domain-containing protein [Pseudomonadales bacterium]
MSKGKRSSKKAPASSGTPGWLLGLITGVVVGGFIMFLWQLKSVPKQPDAFKTESKPAPLFSKAETKHDNKPLNGSDTPPASNKNAPKAELVKPEKTDKDKEGAAEEYSFYSVLSESEQPININKPAPAASKKAEPGSTEPSYMLQAGSFRENAVADSVRAKLLLEGLPVNVQTVKIRDNETWYRVMVGPFTNPAAASEAKDVLAKNKINSMLLQVKTKPATP